MSLVVDLPPEMETQVRRAAESEGVDVSTFLRDAAAARLRPAAPPQSMSETELLAKITEGFSEDFWRRYRVLVAKREAGALSRAEREELVGFSDRTEARAAERLVYLTELAARRGTTVKALMTTLGIRPARVDVPHDF